MNIRGQENILCADGLQLIVALLGFMHLIFRVVFAAPIAASTSPAPQAPASSQHVDCRHCTHSTKIHRPLVNLLSVRRQYSAIYQHAAVIGLVKSGRDVRGAPDIRSLRPVIAHYSQTTRPQPRRPYQEIVTMLTAVRTTAQHTATRCMPNTQRPAA